jgi:hypothetical protein
MKLFRNTDGASETFLQMIWNKKLPWYENLLIWAGGFFCLYLSMPCYS